MIVIHLKIIKWYLIPAANIAESNKKQEDVETYNHPCPEWTWHRKRYLIPIFNLVISIFNKIWNFQECFLQIYKSDISNKHCLNFWAQFFQQFVQVWACLKLVYTVLTSYILSLVIQAQAFTAKTPYVMYTWTNQSRPLLIQLIRREFTKTAASWNKLPRGYFLNHYTLNLFKSRVNLYISYLFS